MKMSRAGTARNQGTVQREFALKIRWDGKANGMSMEARGIQDFNTPAHHNYEFQLSAVSLVKFFEVMVEAVVKGEANGAVEAFTPQARNLMRMALACMEAKALELPEQNPPKAA